MSFGPANWKRLKLMEPDECLTGRKPDTNVIAGAAIVFALVHGFAFWRRSCLLDRTWTESKRADWPSPQALGSKRKIRSAS